MAKFLRICLYLSIRKSKIQMTELSGFFTYFLLYVAVFYRKTIILASISYDAQLIFFPHVDSE